MTASDEARYRPVFATQERSGTLRAIWRSAYGDDYPEEVQPLSFVTRTDLARIAQWLGIGEGDTFADLGCGRGGPALWLARETGASVVGVDIAPEAVSAATGRTASFGLEGRARFQIGDFVDPGLPADRFEAATSIDSLWMVIDKPTAVRSVARLLVPGGRWVCTTWEPRYFRYRELLQDAGLDVLLCEELPDWRERQCAVYDGILRERNALAGELGTEAAAVLVREAEEISPALVDHRRLFIVARR